MAKKVTPKGRYSGDQIALIVIIILFLIPTLFISLRNLTVPFALLLSFLPIPERVATGISALLALVVGVGGTYMIIKMIWPKRRAPETSDTDEAKTTETEQEL